ncbi:MAG: class I SAM-dependent methyltransferase [Pirellulaceae bacterium]
MTRSPTHAEYCHERLGDRFAESLSSYDTRRRVEVLVDMFLTDDMLRGKQVLDVGCGLGFFSERLVQRGASVVASDIGPTLVERTRERVGCTGVVADALELVTQLGRDRFDGVVSSECIEHTPDPVAAIGQMVQVVKPGGFLAVSTPNLLWSPVVRLATRLHLRPFDGYENFSSWGAIRRVFRDNGAPIVWEQGLHLFPFQLPFHRLSKWCDKRCQTLRSLMINICVLAIRQ